MTANSFVLLIVLTAANSVCDDTNSSLETPEVKRFRELLATGGLHRRGAIERIGPDHFLPPGNRRTSEPGVVRVYKTDENGRILERQPDGYPRTRDNDDAGPLGPGEVARLHEGIDYSSRDRSGNAVPMDFRAGVHGKVIQTGHGSPLGRIIVEVDERKDRIEFLHTSKCHVRIGQTVEPTTLLGQTGNRGTAIVHLHVQARNQKGEALNPDEVVAFARSPSAPTKAVPFFKPLKWSVTVPPISDGDFHSKASAPTTPPGAPDKPPLTNRSNEPE